jgi:hypothetical protein
MNHDQESFAVTAQNLAEGIDAILTTERSRERRLALVAHAVRRAMATGFKAGLARASTSDNRTRRRRE